MKDCPTPNELSFVILCNVYVAAASGSETIVTPPRAARFPAFIKASKVLRFARSSHTITTSACDPRREMQTYIKESMPGLNVSHCLATGYRIEEKGQILTGWNCKYELYGGSFDESVHHGRAQPVSQEIQSVFPEASEIVLHKAICILVGQHGSDIIWSVFGVL